MYFVMSSSITTNVTSSMKNVPLGSKNIDAVISMPFYRVPELLPVRRTGACCELLDLCEYVHEHDHEQQVDEVHRLDQSDGQEEVRSGLGLDLGLTRDRRDGLATGQAVTDRRADGTTAEGESAADECSRDADRTCDCLSCHCLFLLVGVTAMSRVLRCS